MHRQRCQFAASWGHQKGDFCTPSLAVWIRVELAIGAGVSQVLTPKVLTSRACFLVFGPACD